MATVKRNRKPGKLVAIKGERLTVGVDVHAATFYVAVWSLTRGLLATWVQPSDARVLMEKLQPVKEQIVRLVYEAGPTGFGLARQLRAAGFPGDVVAPSHIPVLPGRQPKSDRLDCVKLARLAAQPDELRALAIPSEQQEADRQVVRLREQIGRKRRRIKQQIKSFLLQHGIAQPQGLEHWSVRAVDGLRTLELNPELRFALDGLLAELDWLKAHMAKVHARVLALAREERYREDVRLLRSAKGVGFVTAMGYLTELFNPQRFTAGTEVARQLGLCPGVQQSGKTNRPQPLMKSGSTRLRTLLVESAWRGIRFDPALRKCHDRLVHNTGSGKKAIVGVARHLGIVLWKMLLNRRPYQPQAA
jgi:transposase